MSFAFALAHKSKTSKAEDNKTLTPTKDYASRHYPARELDSESSDHIFHLERVIANQALQSLMHSNARGFDFSEIAIQPKLRVSQPEDEYAQEADRVANSVMRMSSHESPDLNENIIGEEQVNRKCSACEMKEDEKHLKVSRKPSKVSDLEATDEVANYIRGVISNGSSSLDLDTREFMESRFGHDFSNVRVHTGEMAARSANYVNAHAYTVGNHIVFGEGQYNPNIWKGKELLAHELTHFIQQETSTKGIALQKLDSSLSVIQRAPAEMSNLKKLAELLDDGQEDEAIALMRRLGPNEVDTVLRDSHLLDLAVDAFDNEEMAEAVQLLGGTLKQKLSWMVAEGTDDSLVYKTVRLAPDPDLSEVAGDTTLMGGLRRQMSEVGYMTLSQMLNRGLLTYEKVESELKQKHYEQSDPHDPRSAWKVQEFSGRVSYEIQYTRTQLLVIVRIKLTGEPTTEPQRSSWRAGIQNRWNGHFHADNGRRRLTILFDPQFTSDKADHTVKIHPGPKGREDQANWYAGPRVGDTTSGDTAAHEFGHMIGLEDEYRLTLLDFMRVVGRGPTPAEIANPGGPYAGYSVTLPALMRTGGGDVQGRHLRPFLAWLNAHRVLGEPSYLLKAGK